MKHSGIYIIININTHRVYVGSTVRIDLRKNAHIHLLRSNRHHSPKLQNSWNKHGEVSFRWICVERCEVTDLVVREQHWINHFDSFKRGYNCAPIAGNMLGFKFGPPSEETRKKIGDGNRGKKRSKDQIEKQIRRQTGSKRQPETGQKISNSKRGAIFTAEHCANISKAKKGIVKISDETKIKMRDAKLGRRLSSVHRQKISDGLRNQKPRGKRSK